MKDLHITVTGRTKQAPVQLHYLKVRETPKIGFITLEVDYTQLEKRIKEMKHES